MNSRSLRDEAGVARASRGLVCAVTVTYGNRWHLLRQVLTALLDEKGIWKVIVVSNGCSWDVHGLAGELAPERIEVIDLQSNRGSAAGFAAGIKWACDLGTDFIWLLDDDNEPQQGALSELLAAHSHLGNNFPDGNLAVAAFRAGRQRDVAMCVPLRRVKRRASSFWGFHVFDVPYKVWRRMPWGRPSKRQEMPSTVEISVASYGGLLFHREVVEKHGLPREDFVVYGDDGEYTSRISQGGGTIRLVPAAKVMDLDFSWNLAGPSGSSLWLWITGGSDMRVFYGARNHTYLDSHCFAHNRLMFWANCRIYRLALWSLAISRRRVERYKLLQIAIRDGLNGRLGARSEFPLQQ